jgi:hypothetical protein
MARRPQNWKTVRNLISGRDLKVIAYKKVHDDVFGAIFAIR